MGCTVRGVCDELGIKSTQTAFNAINRGKQYAIEHGIDVEERRIEIDKLFKQTLGALAKTLQEQSENGCQEFFVDQDGRKSLKRRPGVDPRIAGELSRSLNRWAEFCGLLERAAEVNQATTLIQLSAPTDGASFSDRWSSASEPVDVSPIATGYNLPTEEAGGQLLNSPALTGSDAAGPADLAQNPAQNTDSPTTGGREVQR